MQMLNSMNSINFQGSHFNDVNPDMNINIHGSHRYAATLGTSNHSWDNFAGSSITSTAIDNNNYNTQNMHSSFAFPEVQNSSILHIPPASSNQNQTYHASIPQQHQQKPATSFNHACQTSAILSSFPYQQQRTQQQTSSGYPDWGTIPSHPNQPRLRFPSIDQLLPTQTIPSNHVSSSMAHKSSHLHSQSQSHTRWSKLPTYGNHNDLLRRMADLEWGPEDTSPVPANGEGEDLWPPAAENQRPQNLSQPHLSDNFAQSVHASFSGISGGDADISPPFQPISPDPLPNNDLSNIMQPITNQNNPFYAVPSSPSRSSYSHGGDSYPLMKDILSSSASAHLVPN